jgi:hypothetical protein
MSWVSEDWITKELFVGEFEYPTNQFDDVDRHIERISRNILTKLLGADLYNLFIDEGYTEDTGNIYYKLRVGETITKENGDTFNYDGLTEMMLYFVLSALQERYYINVSGGMVREQFNNADQISPTAIISNANSNYNKGVSDYYEAKAYLYENREVFPSWKFQNLSQKSLIR